MNPTSSTIAIPEETKSGTPQLIRQRRMRPAARLQGLHHTPSSVATLVLRTCRLKFSTVEFATPTFIKSAMNGMSFWLRFIRACPDMKLWEEWFAPARQ